MKWWRFSGLVSVLVAHIGYAVPAQPDTGPGSPPAWQLRPAQQLVIDGNGIDISVNPVATAGAAPTAVVVYNRDRPPRLAASYRQGVLTLSFSEPLLEELGRLTSRDDVKPPHAHVVVTVPQNLQNLTVKNSATLRMLLPDSVQQLTLQDSAAATIIGHQLPLQRLQLNHVKQLSLQGLASTDLLASIQESGLISLEGDVGLRELQVGDSAKVVIGRVNSRQFTLQAHDHAQVYLSGAAAWLNAEVFDQAHLDAKYMNSQTAFIKTRQHAVSEVTVAASLNANAQDTSSIYYYRQPKLLSRYDQDLASILFMGDTPPPCAEPECKQLSNKLPG